MFTYRLSALIVLFLLFGCADEDTETLIEVADASLDTSVPDSAVSQCESGISFWFDESGSAELVLYPNDRYTQPDEDSPTGIRLRFESERFPWFDNLPNLLAPERADMESFSGFAHNEAYSCDTTEPRCPIFPRQKRPPQMMG